MNRSRKIILGALFLSLLGCSAIPDKKADVNGRMEKASVWFKGEYQFVYVPSHGVIEDGIFLTISEPSKLAKMLSRDLVDGDTYAKSQNKSVQFAISGPADKKTVRVIGDALKLLGVRKIDNVSLMYLGDFSYSSEVRSLVEGVGAHYIFVDYK